MAECIDKNYAWDEGILQDWYMNSIDNTIPPIWTEEHISELCNDFIVIPKDALTVDAAPVVHGFWESDEALSEEEKIRCSRCKTEYELEILNNMHLGYAVPYCPNCGAKMTD